MRQDEEHAIRKFEGDLLRLSPEAVKRDPALFLLMHRPVKLFDRAFQKPSDYRYPVRSGRNDSRPPSHQEYDERLKTLFSIHNPRDLESGQDALLIVAVEGRCDFKRVKNVKPEDLISWPAKKERRS